MLQTSQLNVLYQSPNQLKPYRKNARKHSAKQLRQIADSINAFGFNNPVLLDTDNTIIAGHGRVEAAKTVGLETIPTIQLAHMTDGQKRAYILADNRLAEKAGWDKSILAIEFQHLAELDLDFDLTITGFDMPEIDILLQGEDDPAVDDIPAIPSEPITHPGDIWQLGQHRIICANSLEESTYGALLCGEKANLVFTDPPYNVPVQGHVSGRGKVHHDEFAMASGEMSSSQFVNFLDRAFFQMTEHSIEGSLHFICMDWRHIHALTVAGLKRFTELKNLCVWNKDRGGMGTLYRSKHELIFLFKHGKSPHTNNVELGKHGRYRTNVWDYPAVNSFKGSQGELGMHPTVKPVRMIADALMDCSNLNDLILDPFGGSGSTLIAAEQTNRRACLIELEPRYVDVTIQRWEKLTGQKAVLTSGGDSNE